MDRGEQVNELWRKTDEKLMKSQRRECTCLVGEFIIGRAGHLSRDSVLLPPALTSHIQKKSGTFLRQAVQCSNQPRTLPIFLSSNSTSIIRFDPGSLDSVLDWFSDLSDCDGMKFPSSMPGSLGTLHKAPRVAI